jgi:hypothetical protein
MMIMMVVSLLVFPADVARGAAGGASVGVARGPHLPTLLRGDQVRAPNIVTITIIMVRPWWGPNTLELAATEITLNLLCPRPMMYSKPESSRYASARLTPTWPGLLSPGM